MKDVIARSGYDLAAKILESHPNDAIETLLKYSNGAECDWLEFKAGMMLLPEDVAKGNKPDDLYWDYLLSIVAMANTRGGAFVIGVNDKTHEAVPLSSCDPRHVIEKEGKEAYLRKEVLDRFDRSERKWTTKDGTVWGLTTSIVSFVDARIVQYRGADAIVLLVSSNKPGGEMYVTRKVKEDEYEDLPIRKKGEVGRVKRLTRRADCDAYVREREVLSPQLGAWWAELDAEQQASKADEILDNAIRAYHAKLEEETRKNLRAFIPLDVEGDEPDEEDVEEFENPQAISVFDEDDDAWLNSNNKDGDTSDKGSKGSEVEDEAGDLDDDDEFEDDEKETSRRTIKIGLYELLEQQNRVVLVGEPGAGKTTCLAHFAVQQGKMERPRPHLFAFIALGRWVDGGSVRGLVEKTCGISQAQIDTLLAEKRLHLILDALNECPDRLHPGAMENIRILLRDHPDLPVVLSSRKAEGVKLSGIPVFEVQSMGTDRQRLFLERYLHDADAAQKILDSLLKQPGGASIAQNPMLLRMVVDVVRVNGDLPTGRASLYRRWLENWYAREEKKAKKAKDVLPWSKEESIRLLSQMAFAGRAEGYRDIPLDMARHSLGDKDGTFLDRLCQGPLLEIEEGFVHFRHETIQEYLCAEWLLAEPAALNSLPEKDYDTWGMPIAYAAELRLPNKLPNEISEAIWEMNPWVAALVAASPSVRFDRGVEKRPELILSHAIYHRSGLLFADLQEVFCREISKGALFQRRDPALSYLVRCSENFKGIWEVFESAYVLRMPAYKTDWLSLGKYFRQSKGMRRMCRAKVANMIILTGDNLIAHVRDCFPDISFSDVIERWLWFFQNPSITTIIESLGKAIETSPDLKPFPIEAMSLVLDYMGKYSGARAKIRLPLLLDYLGPDYIQRTLDSISLNPKQWNSPRLWRFLKFAEGEGYAINVAVRSMVSWLLRVFEDLAVLPSNEWIQRVFKQLISHLDASDASILMPRLSVFGLAVLKYFDFNPDGVCNSFYKLLPSVVGAQFQGFGLDNIVRRREVLTVLLSHEFPMSLSDVTARHITKIVNGNDLGIFVERATFYSDKFPEGVQYVRRWHESSRQRAALVRGSLYLVKISIAPNKSGRFKYYVASFRRAVSHDISEQNVGGSVRQGIDGIVDESSKGASVPAELECPSGEGKPSLCEFKQGNLSQFIKTVWKKIASARTLSKKDTIDLNGNSSAESEGSQKQCDDGAKMTLHIPYCMRDLIAPANRERIEKELDGVRWVMMVCRMSKHGGRVSFSNPSFKEVLHCPSSATKYADVFAVGQQWSVVVGVKKKHGVFLFVPESVEPSHDAPACPFREGKPVNKNANQVSVPPSTQEVCSSLPLSSAPPYMKSDLSDSDMRERIQSELKAARWEMKVAFISEDRGYLFFNHPSFQDGVYCPAWSTQYQDVFEVGQVWNVRVCVKQNKKNGTFGFVARSVKPSKANPTCLPGNEKEKPVITRQQEGLSLAPAATSESHISIYIDETWPGTQDHAYENIGVIGGVVVPWEGVDEKKLPVVKTHLDNGSEARNAIQTMLRQSEVFPFVFPIKCDQAVGTGGRQYFELVQHALMLLLGWMLPQRGQPTSVDVFLEHISGYMDGHDETDFINSLTQAMRLLSGGRRFANWQIRRVEWVDKEFGYVPYGDLVCKTCVPREEQQLLAREVKVREWEGFLPFSKDVFPLLRDMDTASPSGLADLLISFAKMAEDTPFFRRVRKLAIDRAKADEAVCTALISRFEECYARPDRDMSLLNRVVPHFLKEFPPDLFKERPRLQLLRILIGFQHANHNGDPDLATALVDQYHSLRPRILELDRDLCACADLNLAVHHHDSFEFDKALSLVDGWINDPLFPALSVMNRGRMYSSRGQSLALLGRNREADEAFSRALSIFSAEPELLASDIAQTKTYQAMNALDYDAPSAMPLVEGLLGRSLIAMALNLTALLERPFAAHLFLKKLWRMREERSVVQDALIKNLPADIAFRQQHPYELILFYLALLTKEANPSYAKACVREMEQFFEAIEFGGTLGLIHAYMRVMLKRHGLNVATEKEFFGELDIVEQYLPKAGTMIDTLRAGWTNTTIPVESILSFNYC